MSTTNEAESRPASEESYSYVMENDKHIGNVDRVRGGGGLAAVGWINKEPTRESSPQSRRKISTSSSIH